MPQSFCKCGPPAMTARLSPGTTSRSIRVECASIDRLYMDPIPERCVPVPVHLGRFRALAIHPYPTVYNHQAVALDLLNEGHNAVVSTLTASGKTLIFMVLALHVT